MWIRLLRPWGKHGAGEVVAVDDRIGRELVSDGYATLPSPASIPVLDKSLTSARRKRAAKVRHGE